MILWDTEVEAPSWNPPSGSEVDTSELGEKGGGVVVVGVVFGEQMRGLGREGVGGDVQVLFSPSPFPSEGPLVTRYPAVDVQIAVEEENAANGRYRLVLKGAASLKVGQTMLYIYYFLCCS